MELHSWEHSMTFTIHLVPTIADMEREHPMFKEVVKLAITPMISSLSTNGEC